MRQRVRHLLHLLLGTLLGWLGFSSCGFINIGNIRVEYGSPHINFQASGKVTDASGKGIEGIRVAVRAHRHYENSPGVIYDQNDWYDDDTLYTEADGRYRLIQSITSFTAPDDVTIVFEDVDGDEHGGSFASQTVMPEIKQTGKGNGNWFHGTFSVEADAQLKKQ